MTKIKEEQKKEQLEHASGQVFLLVGIVALFVSLLPVVFGLPMLSKLLVIGVIASAIGIAMIYDAKVEENEELD